MICWFSRPATSWASQITHRSRRRARRPKHRRNRSFFAHHTHLRGLSQRSSVARQIDSGLGVLPRTLILIRDRAEPLLRRARAGTVPVIPLSGSLLANWKNPGGGNRRRGDALRRGAAASHSQQQNTPLMRGACFSIMQRSYSAFALGLPTPRRLIKCISIRPSRFRRSSSFCSMVTGSTFTFSCFSWFIRDYVLLADNFDLATTSCCRLVEHAQATPRQSMPEAALRPRHACTIRASAAAEDAVFSTRCWLCGTTGKASCAEPRDAI